VPLDSDGNPIGMWDVSYIHRIYFANRYHSIQSFTADIGTHRHAMARKRTRTIRLRRKSLPRRNLLRKKRRLR
jgi:hypothetical protein